MSIRKAAQRFILYSQGIDPNNLDIQDLAIKNIELEEKIKKLQPRFKFENNSFIMYLPDGTQASIDFADIRGRRDMLDMFGVLFSLWKERGQLEKGWVWVAISKKDLREGLAVKGRRDIADNWIRNTLSNIRKYKIKPSKLNNHINLGYYRRKAGIYPFLIKKL